MTDPLAAELQAAIRAFLVTPDFTSADLVARVTELLPGEPAVTSTAYSGGGWAEDIRWIGRAGIGLRLRYGASYGSRSCWQITTTAGWSDNQWPQSDAENERLNRLIRGDL